MEHVEVTKALISRFGPFLVNEGFDDYLLRTYGRYQEEQIDIVNFHFIRDKQAEQLGCNTYSYTVGFGLALSYIPFRHPVKQENGRYLPKDNDAPIRKVINKGIIQPELARNNIWFVREDGTNLQEVVNDAYEQVNDALEWFDQFRSKEKVMELLLHHEQYKEGVWGFDEKGSPARDLLIGHVASALGETSLAKEKFSRVIEFYLEQYKVEKEEYYQGEANYLLELVKKLR